jgi:predicted ArsR family transcriptional regulator
LADRLLALLADGTPRSTGELAAAAGVDRLGVTFTMERLKQTGRVVAVGTRHAAPARGGWQAGRTAPQTVWALPGHA